jgi:hypothetical protein
MFLRDLDVFFFGTAMLLSFVLYREILQRSEFQVEGLPVATTVTGIEVCSAYRTEPPAFGFAKRLVRQFHDYLFTDAGGKVDLIPFITEGDKVMFPQLHLFVNGFPP